MFLESLYELDTAWSSGNPSDSFSRNTSASNIRADSNKSIMVVTVPTAENRVEEYARAVE